MNHGERITPIMTRFNDRFKTSMIRSSFCDYSDVYVYVTGTLTIPNTGTAEAPNNINKKVIFKNCFPFTDCISTINNTHKDDANYIEVVVHMYNL